MNSHPSAFSNVRSSPGSLLHYQKPSYGAPLWPGIHLDVDLNIFRLLGTSRPLIPGSITPVLLLGKRLELCWALDTEIREYDPFASTRDVRAVSNTPGLAEAYDLVDFALESGVGLEYWKDQIVSQTVITVSDDDDTGGNNYSAGSNEFGDVSGLDEDMEAAIIESRKEYYRLNGPQIRKPPVPQTQSLKRSGIAVGGGTTSEGQPQDLLDGSSGSKNLQPGFKKRKGTSPMSETGDCLIQDVTRKPRPWNITNHPTAHAADERLSSPLAPSAEQLDAIEGDINESEAFVQIYVGPDRQEYMIAKQDIWNRVYFRDPVSGRNYFDAKGEKTWELVHPRLPDIQSEAFEYISEYLSSADADFGIRNPCDEAAAEEAFTQCLVAWKTADLLGMNDLLDCIVAKVRKIEPWWTIWTIMLFARNIYETTDFLLSTHVEMRDILSSYIAEHFFDYMTVGSQLRNEFLKHLRQLPQLERDIYRKRLEVLNAQLPSDGELEIQEEEPEIQDRDIMIGEEPKIQQAP